MLIDSNVCQQDGCSLSNESGNGWFCLEHYEAAKAEVKAQYEARQNELKQARKNAAAKALATKHAKANGTYDPPARTKNYEAYRRIKRDYCLRKWGI